MRLFSKTDHPILAPGDAPAWASGAVFNPGAWHADGCVHLLFRAVPEGYRRITLPDPAPGEPTTGYDDYVSRIGYAVSTDGVAFTCRATPLIAPDADFDRYGAEDPRITRLDGQYLITYTALSQPAFGDVDGVRIGLATSPDFASVRKHRPIGPDRRDKDAVIFPRRIGGRIAMLHRIVPDVQLIFFEDLDQLLAPPARLWEAHLARLDQHVVLRPEAPWEGTKVGAGPPPIETEEGWLLVYHGVDAQYVYRAGLALLDLDDPLRVVARTPVPVLEPELPFERVGDVNNVVFPEGAVVIGETLHLYYGAADKVVGHAQAPLADVLDALRAPAPPGWMASFPAVALEEGPPRTITAPPPVAPERLHGGRPVLTPEPGHAWEAKVVLNPAAVLVEAGSELDALAQAWGLTPSERQQLQRAGGACVMLYRAQGVVDPQLRHAASSLGLAVFTPGLEPVRRWPWPVLAPGAPQHNLGVEDPRCTKVGDTYYLYYTGYSTGQPGVPDAPRRVQVCLATTRDFVDWNLHGPAGGDLNVFDNKNAALLPETVGGRWLLLHRPMAGPGAMAIHWAEADDPAGPWRTRGVLMKSFRYRAFVRSWIGAGGPPLALGGGRFLMIYHQGHFAASGAREYDLAAALLDFGQEPVVRSRIEPLMRPRGAEELMGDAELGVDNVLFTCANYRWKDDLVIPYAAADSRIFGARVPVADLVAALEAGARPR